MKSRNDPAFAPHSPRIRPDLSEKGPCHSPGPFGKRSLPDGRLRLRQGRFCLRPCGVRFATLPCRYQRPGHSEASSWAGTLFRSVLRMR
jgi:hypothetical protein